MNLVILLHRLRSVRDTDPPMSIIILNQLIEEIEHAVDHLGACKVCGVIGKDIPCNAGDGQANLAACENYQRTYKTI